MSSSSGKPANRRIKPPRRDPPPRMINTSQTTNELLNRQPGVRYCFVSKPFLEQYENVGWKEIRYVKGGVRPKGRLEFKEGEPVVVEGSLLMGISEEDWQQIQEYGGEGASGQDLLDRLDAQVIDQNSIVKDDLRGIRRGFIQIVNETTANEPY